MSTWYSACINFYAKDKELLSACEKRICAIHERNRRYIFDEVSLKALVDDFYSGPKRTAFDCNGTFISTDEIETIGEYYYFRV